MAPAVPAWKRLIRFRAKEDGKIYHGQPTTDDDIGLLYHAGKVITAQPLSTSSPLCADAVLLPHLLTVDELLSPLGRDQMLTIRGLGMQYPGPGIKKPEEVPILFYKPITTLAGPERKIVVPRVAKGEGTDFEVELGVVIARDCKDITKEEAMEYVLGYCTVNDVSSRQLQAKGAQWGIGKGFDTWTPMGPVLVHPSALGDPLNLSIKTTLNGNLVQDANTSQLLIGLAESIAALSQGCTLEAGSLVMTGSPLPLGRAEGKAPFLKHKDEVRCWVQGCDTLISYVEEEGGPNIKAKL